MEGPNLPTTIGGIHAALGEIAREAAAQPSPAVPHAPAINVCLLNSEFIVEHIRTSGAQSAASIPYPSKALITTIVSALFRRPVTMRGDALRTDVWFIVFLFSTPVLGPHRARAPSSPAKADTKARIDLGQRGEPRELANMTVAARLARPPGNRSNKRKLLDAPQLYYAITRSIARAAGLADSKGISNATQDTLDAIPEMFKEPGSVDEETLRRLYGPRVTPTRESMAVTLTPEDVYKCLATVTPLTTPHKNGWRAEHLLALC